MLLSLLGYNKNFGWDFWLGHFGFQVPGKDMLPAVEHCTECTAREKHQEQMVAEHNYCWWWSTCKDAQAQGGLAQRDRRYILRQSFELQGHSFHAGTDYAIARIFTEHLLVTSFEKQLTSEGENQFLAPGCVQKHLLPFSVNAIGPVM